MSKKKILIISDSLGLPRESGEDLVPFESTWVNLLKKNYDTHQVSMGGATIYQLYEQIKYNALFNPDIVIVQCGIVDCAPRAFKIGERQLLESMPLIKIVFKKISEKYGRNIRNSRNVNYTKPGIFKYYINKIKDSFKDVPVYFIGIVPAVDGYEKRMKNITKNIALYNNILKTEANDKFIDTDSIKNDGLLSDFHHLNVKGNKMLYEKIMQQLSI
ncbi:MAG: SGNH/GDSL hydrolase family protein [Bacteroidota bacterium]